MKKRIVSFILIFATPVFAQTAAQRQDISINLAAKTKPEVARAFAYAPNIISKCNGSIAGGAQGQFIGLSLAGSYKDEFCERIELIKLAISMGHNDVADDLFYQFPMIKELDKPIQTIDVCIYPTDECKQKRRK